MSITKQTMSRNSVIDAFSTMSVMEFYELMSDPSDPDPERQEQVRSLLVWLLHRASAYYDEWLAEENAIGIAWAVLDAGIVHEDRAREIIDSMACVAIAVLDEEDRPGREFTPATRALLEQIAKMIDEV
jgi:hypothetical protein